MNNKIFSALKLLKQAFGSYQRQIVVLSGLGFLSGLLEGIGVNAIIPLFALLTKETQIAGDFISRSIARLFEFLGLNLNFTFLALLIALLFILKAILLFVGNYLNAKITADYEKQIRGELLGAVLASSWPYLLRQKIGHLEKILMEHVTRASQALMELSSSILLISTLLTYVIVALNISSIITVLTLALGLLIFLIFKPLLYRTRVASSTLANVSKDSAHLINEHMIGIKTVKASSAEGAVLVRARHFFEILKAARVKLSSQEALTNGFLQPLSIIFILAVFAFSYQLPGFYFASFAVILYLIQKMFVYIQNAQGKLQAMIGFIPYLKNVVWARQEAFKNRELNVGKKPFRFREALAAKNVQFIYEERGGEVIKEVSFVIRRGEMVGLIGPSGAGKTTVVDLLLRLLRPTAGQILIDGENIELFDLQEWRKAVAYVSQEIFLLNDTIAKNIRFYDESLTEGDLILAAQMANLLDFIRNLPKQWETVVGERGMALSGGERQRIILARVLARKPQILVLDEATSALDRESEILVQKALLDLRGSLTILVIAHRLSTVKDMDRLLVLENGKITEQGTPQQLLQDKSSYFFKVYRMLEEARV